MSRWFETDKWKFGKQDSSSASDKGPLEFSDLDPVELQADLGGGALVKQEDGRPRIFGKFDQDKIRELLEWSGVFEALRRKGYTETALELQHLDELDQRIFVRAGDEILIHLRLKLSEFRFKLHPGEPRFKLMYIDWLMTRHPRIERFDPGRLFPGQDVPGLGIFSQISDFMSNLALGVGARGMLNLPEFFHDALLFQRFCKFYDPRKEIVFRGLIRDLRKIGARRISNALSDGRIRDSRGETVAWRAGEMLSPLHRPLRELLWSEEYHRQVREGLKNVRFRLVE